MAATPQNGSIKLRGLQSGRDYSVSFYDGDVVNAFTTFNLVGVAASTSVNFLTAPEDVVLTDISIITGTADTKTLIPWSNDSPIPGGAVIANANIVNTLNSRTFPVVGWKKGSKIQFQEQ